MPNLRDLKKDINFLTDEVLDACFVQQQLGSQNSENIEKTNALIEDVIKYRNDIITRINNPSDEDQSNLKKYYNALVKSMIDKAEEVLDQLDDKKE